MIYFGYVAAASASPYSKQSQALIVPRKTVCLRKMLTTVRRQTKCIYHALYVTGNTAFQFCTSRSVDPRELYPI